MKRPPSIILMPFLGAGVGGSHVSGVILAQALQREYGLRCVILAPQSARVLSLAADYGLESVALDEAPSSTIYDFASPLLKLPKLVRILRDFGGEAILHTNDLSALLRWGPAARLAGLPVIHHDRAAGRPILKRHICKLADHVITISQFCYDRLFYIEDRNKTLVTDPFSKPEMYDRRALKGALLAEMGAPPTCELVGFSANLWRRKRPEFFLEVAAELASRRDQIRFVVFGRSGEITEQELSESVLRRGLAGKCLIAGFRSPAEANIAALDVLAIPAVNEPFGRTPIEAILSGVPYVATDDAGHGEIIGKWRGGIAVAKVASAREFASAIETALNGPETIALDDEARNRVADALTPASHAENVRSVYLRVLSQSAR